MNDDQLHDLIRQTQPQLEFPTSFQRDVWARIAVAEQQTLASRWQEVYQSVMRWIAQPAPAVAMVTTMLILGSGLGYLSAADHDGESLKSAYFASISPVATATPNRYK
jgi:hypothetical protein